MRLSFGLMVVLLVFAGLSACGDDGGGATGTTGSTGTTGTTGSTPPTYTVSYDANGGTASVPTDGTEYTNGQTVTVRPILAAGTKTGYRQPGPEGPGWGAAAGGMALGRRTRGRIAIRPYA